MYCLSQLTDKILVRMVLFNLFIFSLNIDRCRYLFDINLLGMELQIATLHFHPTGPFRLHQNHNVPP